MENINQVQPSFKLIRKRISEETLREYHSKMRAFKYFRPIWLTIGDSSSVEYEPNNFVSLEEYQQMVPDLNNKLKLYLKKTNVGFNDINNAYLYDFNPKPEEEFDELDKEFITLNGILEYDGNPIKNENEDEEKPKYILTKYEFYGLHTYGGYRGFFRPDLNEVINLMSEKIKKEDLNHIERMYVNTEPYPSDKIYECYDSKSDRHKARTIVYIIEKNDHISVRVKDLGSFDMMMKLRLSDTGYQIQRKIAEKTNIQFNMMKMIHEGAIITTFTHFYQELKHWYKENKPIYITLRLGGPDPLVGGVLRYVALDEESQKLFDIEQLEKFYFDHIEESTECHLCMEYAINIFSNCGHWACRSCWDNIKNHNVNNEIVCPTCRARVIKLLDYA